jgi:ribosomal protein L37AE/L43A
MKDLFGFELRQQRVTCNACGAAFMRRRTNHRYCCDKCRIRKFYQHVRAEEKVIDAKIDELMRREARL